MSEYLYQDIFHTADYAASPWLLAHALAVVTAIYAAGCLTELIRQKSFTPLWDSLIKKILPPLEKWANKCAVAAAGILGKLF